MRCRRCGSANLRISRPQVWDFPRWLLFQRPVRCHACFAREFVSYRMALRIGRGENESDDRVEGMRQG